MRKNLRQSLMLGIGTLLRRYPWKGKTWLWFHARDLLKTSHPCYVDARYPAGYTLVLNLKEFWQVLMLADCYDRRELWVLKKLLHPGDVFFDIGANAGYYSFAAAARVKSGWVYAFEPHPVMAGQLRRSLEKNPHLNVRLFEAALSEKAGDALFFIPPDDGYHSVEGSLEARAGFSEKKISALTLDQLCREQGIPKINLAKVDVEGAEPKVLRGAAGSLASGALESILCEVKDETREEIFSILTPFSFEHVIDLRTWKPADVQSLRPGLTNLLWLRGECARRWEKIGWQKFLI